MKFLGGGWETRFLIIFIILICHVNKANAWNSIMEFESRSGTGALFDYLGNLSFCFPDDLVMNPLDYPEVQNIYLPPILGVNTPPVTVTNDTTMLGMLIADGARWAIYMSLLSEQPGLAVLALATELLIMIEVCTNSYVVQPWEYISRENEVMTCEEDSNGNYYNANPKALTATDIPFYYSCDPAYDPSSGKTLPIDSEMVGLVWGYMGAASPYCVGDAKKYAMKERVGQVRVEATRGWAGRFWAGYDRCSSSDRIGLWLKAGEQDSDQGSVQYYAYYSFNASAAKIQICVISPYTALPLTVGCSQVAPPAQSNAADAWLVAYTAGTRCYYLLTGRSDLHALGGALPQTDSKGHSGTAIKGFLQSDFHITSTVVGCVKDLIIEAFLSPAANPISMNHGFLIVVQSNLNSIVYAALTLYVALIGIRIISSPQVPSQGEFAMFIIKFALVAYFITPSAWYYVANGQAQGLFPTLVWASDEIAGLFLSAANDNDPVGLCRYLFDKSELLGQRNIDPTTVGSSAIPTIGSNMIKMTVWDLLDCKLVNYINFGSCKYSLAGIIGMWIVNAALFVGGSGILLMIVSFIYTWILVLTVFKFAHIFILSVFMIAILVLLSPIFLCFALFEGTKSIFQNWFKLILGYIMYPALLFAFIALMLVTFDSIYFGEFTLETNDGTLITSQCKKVESIYCTTVNQLGKNYEVADPCEFTIGTVSAQLTEDMDLGPLGTFTRLRSNAASNYLDVVVKMMLYALLFYFFIGTVTSFLAILTGVQDLGNLAKGSIDVAALMKKGGGMLMGSITGMLDKASSGVGKGGGSGKGGSGLLGMS